MSLAPKYSSAAPREEKDKVLSFGVGEVINSKFFAAEAIVIGLYGGGDMMLSRAVDTRFACERPGGERVPLALLPNIKMGYGEDGAARCSVDGTPGERIPIDVGRESREPVEITPSPSDSECSSTETERQNADLRLSVVESVASSDDGHSTVTAGDSMTGLSVMRDSSPGGTKRGDLGTMSCEGRGLPLAVC
jgi:hypothetical protein